MIKDLEFDARMKPASEEDIGRFEAQFGLVLPPSFVDFWRKYNGGGLTDSNRVFDVPRQFIPFWQEYGSENVSATVEVDFLCGILPESFPYSVFKALDQLAPDEVTGSVRGRDPLPPLSETLSSKGKVLPIGYDLMGNYVLAICRYNGVCTLDFWDHEIESGFAFCDDLEEFYNGLTGANP